MDDDYKKMKIMLFQLNREITDVNHLIKDLNATYEKIDVKSKISDDIKDNIIGKLPRLLLSDQIFPGNVDRALFAEKYLNIKIPSPHKKSKKDIIGRIVVEIEELDSKEITRLNNILNRTVEKLDEDDNQSSISTYKITNKSDNRPDDDSLNKDEKKKRNRFFIQWEKAISDLNIR